ncbi:hypothetical protein [Vibrio sp. Sgm 5]|uniref:hypothetical protein n=1 Tax=Vibrio sp. Sgm 5 TaxID=2994387 RepID=UPI002249602D|nr:hypothetical protein [Vibrio sp. Sgm 5]MCX2791507.1 hypothetical protein [Vibrio sp. Sgm 5]
MKYLEFLNAARKHKHTSAVLKSELQQHLSKKPVCNGSVKRLTLNLYYISGYVIECSLKYGIYALAGYDRDGDIKHINQGGIDFNRTIKHHRFNVYDDVFNSFHSGLALVDTRAGISQEVINLYNNWDADVRYVYSDIPPKFRSSDIPKYVISFSDYADQIFNQIESHIR